MAEEERDNSGTSSKKELAKQQKIFEEQIERLNEQLREREEALEDKERAQ